MPQKTTKKAATKPVAKKAPAKKPAKKVVKPAAVKPAVAEKPVVTEIPTPVHCCTCTKRKKFIILACTFIVGFLVSQLLFCGCPHKRPRVHFVNGCVDVTSVKCPKMLEKLPAMDTNNDGCITKAELRAAKHALKKQAAAEEPAVNVEEAIAPVAE